MRHSRFADPNIAQHGLDVRADLRPFEQAGGHADRDVGVAEGQTDAAVADVEAEGAHARRLCGRGPRGRAPRGRV